MNYKLRLKGGPGSGHHGHKGIPGHYGGSLPSGESKSGTKKVVEDKGGRAEKLAQKFVELHNAASKEYTAAFKKVGARMWHDDDAHPLKSENQAFIAGQLKRSDGGVPKYSITRPLTVMDSYPNVTRTQRKQVQDAVDAIYEKYQKLWKDAQDNEG